MAAIDNSEHARLVAQEAAKLAQAVDADVVLVSVVPVPSLPASEVEVNATSLREEEREFQDLHKNLIDTYFATSIGLLIESRVLHGTPGDKIVEYADKAHANLIVMGSRGRGKLASALLGSVSEQVVHKSRCSVLIVKCPVL